MSLEKHIKVCKKVFKSKNKAFDSSKQRQVSEKQEEFNRSGKSKLALLNLLNLLLLDVQLTGDTSDWRDSSRK